MTKGLFLLKIKQNIKETVNMKKRICKILAMILGAATVMGTTGITVMADDTVTLTVWGLSLIHI